MSKEELGLREAKKRATRQALSRAALKVASAEGMSAVTAERVAALVGVSPRTFHNYFASREDAILAYAADTKSHLVALLEQQPADRTFWTAFTESVAEIICGDNDFDPSELMTLMRLLENDTALIARTQQQADDGYTRRIEEQYRQRTGGASRSAMYPHLLMVVAISAAQVAIERCHDPNDDRPIDVVLREAFSIAGSDFTTDSVPSSPNAPTSSKD